MRLLVLIMEKSSVFVFILDVMFMDVIDIYLNWFVEFDIVS